jgi:hypothetical protein
MFWSTDFAGKIFKCAYYKHCRLLVVLVVASAEY